MLSLAPASAYAVTVDQSCDRLLSYFVESRSGSGYDWHIYSPAAGTDSVFLAIGPPSYVEWDTTRTQVEFRVGRDIYQAPWQYGSEPRLVARLPDRSGICDAWFNPDSLRWQFYTSVGTGPWTPGRSPLRYYVELWQSASDGQTWHRVHADTVDVTGGMCGRPDGGADDQFLYASPRARRVQHVIRTDLTDAVLPDDSGPTEQVPSDCEFYKLTWYAFAQSRTVANRRVEFRWLSGRAPEFDCPSFPVYLADLEHGSRQVLCAGDPCSNQCVEVSEACGLLLVNCDWHMIRLIDIDSGKNVRTFNKDIFPSWAPPLRAQDSR